MASYFEDDASYARRIVERFLEAESVTVEVEGALVVADVEADAVEFNAELNFFREIDSGVPAARLGDEELVPVALSAIPGLEWYTFPPASFWRRARYASPYMFDFTNIIGRTLAEDIKESPDLTTIPPDQARSIYLERATDFLAGRIAGLREFERGAANGRSMLHLPQRVRGSRIATPGCNFTVSTNSTGLRVFWSGAYRISPNYFSHPTTPASSVLQSGTYVFGVDGGAYGNKIQWDLSAVVSLPGSPSTHLNF